MKQSRSIELEENKVEFNGREFVRLTSPFVELSWTVPRTLYRTGPWSVLRVSWDTRRSRSGSRFSIWKMRCFCTWLGSMWCSRRLRTSNRSGVFYREIGPRGLVEEFVERVYVGCWERLGNVVWQGEIEWYEKQNRGHCVYMLSFSWILTRHYTFWCIHVHRIFNDDKYFLPPKGPKIIPLTQIC